MPLRCRVILLAAFSCSFAAAQSPTSAPAELPAAAAAQLMKSLEAAKRHPRHVWRDTPPVMSNGTVNAYVEIARGDRRKWEFDMAANVRAIDRVVAEEIGGYPVNYGFVPQTISYDGDPFDALVLGPALADGTVVRGIIVGLMHMEDEKGLDSKVVLSPSAADGRALYSLTAAERDRIATYFRTYKRLEPGKFSKVPGWGTVNDGRTYVETTHVFFKECRSPDRRPDRRPCRVRR